MSKEIRSEHEDEVGSDLNESDESDDDEQITEVCFFGKTSWWYRTNRTVGEKYRRCKRMPQGLDKSWAKWAKENRGTWGPPPLALNGIQKRADGQFNIFWADLGDTSNANPNRRGTNREVVADMDALKAAIPGLCGDQLDQIRRAPIGQFLTDTVGKLESEGVDLVAGTSTCLRVRVGPFGYEKSAELTSTTDGCACVAVLMAMPEEFRSQVGMEGMEIIFDNLCDTYVSKNNAEQDQKPSAGKKKKQCEDSEKGTRPSHSEAKIGSIRLCPL